MGNIRLPSLDNTVLHVFTILVQPSKCEAYFLLMNKVTSHHMSKDRMGNLENLVRCLPIQVSSDICLCIFLNDGCKPHSLVNSVVRRYIW